MSELGGKRGQSADCGTLSPTDAVPRGNEPIAVMNTDDLEVTRASPYAWYVLLVLVIVYAFNYIDRQILSILAEDIKKDLGLDDSQLGFLYGTAFAMFYGVFGIPLARLADSWRRIHLIAIGLGFWSSMTALCGFARDFPQLAAARFGVGVGEATASPCAYSLIGDYFPARRRGLALSVYTAGVNVGSGLSLLIGGVVTTGWNRAFAPPEAPLGLSGWQAAFLAVGLPGLLLALWVSTLREPRRGSSTPVSSKPSPPAFSPWLLLRRELCAVLPPLTLFNMARYPGGLKRNLILLGIVASGALGLALVTGDTLQWVVYGVGLYAIGSWSQAVKHDDPTLWSATLGAPMFVMTLAAIGFISAIQYAQTFWTAPYLLRTFYPNLDGPGFFFTMHSAREEVAYFGMMQQAGAIIGVIAGGWLSDHWSARDRRGRLAVVALSVLLYVPVVAIIFSSRNLAILFMCLPLAGIFGAMYWGAGVAALQDMVLPGMRATTGAVTLLASSVIGLAVGPYLTGKIAVVTGSLTDGIQCLFALAPAILLLLWHVSRRIGKQTSV